VDENREFRGARPRYLEVETAVTVALASTSCRTVVL
jgi:hypothetical protein